MEAKCQELSKGHDAGVDGWDCCELHCSFPSFFIFGRRQLEKDKQALFVTPPTDSIGLPF